METFIRLRLRACPLFSELPETALRSLAASARVREMRRGQWLFREGEPCGAVYCLDRGSILLVRSEEEGTETVIRTVLPGELFAEAGLFERKTYPVSARAAAPSRVIGIPRADFLSLLAQADFRGAFLAMLMRRLRYLTDRIQALTAGGVEERLARFLEEHGGRVHHATVEINKKDVAAAIAARPETLSRLLRRLARRRLLTWRGSAVTLTPAFWDRHPKSP